MQRRQQSGFTLVELMITLAVAVILATLAIPSFVSFVEKSRLRGATDVCRKFLSERFGDARGGREFSSFDLQGFALPQVTARPASG